MEHSKIELSVNALNALLLFVIYLSAKHATLKTKYRKKFDAEPKLRACMFGVYTHYTVSMQDVLYSAKEAHPVRLTIQNY